VRNHRATSDGPHLWAKWRESDEAQLSAENAALAERLQRLAPALTGMVHDLAALRRENAALKRENLRLRALLAQSPADLGDARTHASPADHDAWSLSASAA